MASFQAISPREFNAMISVTCSCGRKFKAEAHHAGKRTRCPVCGSLLVIGGAVVTSGVADNGDVPSWWFPSEHPGTLPTATPTPAPSTSNSDPEAMTTMIMSGPAQAPVPVQAEPSKRAAERAGSSLGLFTVVVAVAAVALALLGAVLWLPGMVDVHGKGRDPRMVVFQNPQDAQPGVLATPKAFAKPGTVAKGPKLQLLVPAYFYPAGPGMISWLRLIEAAAKVKIVAIVNVQSGPGEREDPEYTRVIRAAGEGDVTLIGYVNTGYAKRLIADVRQDIDRWVHFYPSIAGFFFDQQATESREVPYYETIRDYAKSKINHALVITNPGINCDKTFLERVVSDATCVFDNFDGFGQFAPPLLPNRSQSRFAALPYNIATPEAMRAVVAGAVIKRIGFLYVSDSPPGANPWGSLPMYWDEEVEAIRKANN